MHPIVALLAGTFIKLLRKIQFRRLRQIRLHALGDRYCWLLTPLVQPYTVLVLMCAAMYFWELSEFIGIVASTNLLQPSEFDLPSFEAADDESCVHDHSREPLSVSPKDECSISEWLRFMCMMAPVCVALTFATTVAHLVTHLRSRDFDENLRWYPSYSHDLAMQVVLLPLIYSLFALDNLVEMLSLMSGKTWHQHESRGAEKTCKRDAWASALETNERLYETNFELADLYEAWALSCFAKLCFMRVSRQIQREAPTVKYLIDRVKDHTNIVGGSDAAILNDLLILDNPEEYLYEPLKTVSSVGVTVFVYTCLCKSALLLTRAILTMPPPRGMGVEVCGEHGRLPILCEISAHMDGAAFLASSLAIYNIIVLEDKLKILLHREKFLPFEKFLSVKVMVSIAFMQSFALHFVVATLYGSAISKAQLHLIYTAFVCPELLGIAALVFYAWKPREDDWYHGDFSYHGHSQGAHVHGRLAGDLSFNADADGVFVRSRWPTSLVPRTLEPLADLNEVAAHLDPFGLLDGGESHGGTIELTGHINGSKGKAICDLINALTESPCRPIKAVYRPAPMLRHGGGRRSETPWPKATELADVESRSSAILQEG